MLPTEWDEAGAAPNNNIIGSDPGLRDPEGGDYNADLAVGYGCRDVPAVPIRFVAGYEGQSTAEPIRAIDGTIREVGGDITEDTVWDSAVMRVTANVIVRNGAILTVAAGTTVEFSGYHGLLLVDGSLQSVGTPADPIVWTTDEPELFAIDLSTNGCWNGLTFLNVPAANGPSVLKWNIIEYAKAIPGHGLDPREPRSGGQALDGAGGGVRVVGASRVELNSCIVRYCCAERGGAMAAHYGASPRVVNSLLHDNAGLTRTGAVLVSYSFPHIGHVTVTANEALNESPFIHTGAIDHRQSKPRYDGCIVYGNSTNYYANVQILEPKAYYTHYSNIGGFGLGQGGLDADPLFTLQEPHPYALASDSPCRDAGHWPSAGVWLPAVDLAGTPRQQGAEVDLGCYEIGVVAPVVESPLGDNLDLRTAPNPFNPRTELRFVLSGPGPVHLEIVDARGCLLRTLVNESMNAGEIRIAWDGTDARGRQAAAGIYFARLTALGRQEVRSLTLIK